MVKPGHFCPERIRHKFLFSRALSTGRLSVDLHPYDVVLEIEVGV